MLFELFNIYTLSVMVCLFIFFNLKNIKNTEKKDSIIENKSSRIYFFDFIKGLAIFAVLIMHINYFYKGNLGELYFLIIKICRFAVPFFIISSGFLLKLEDYTKESIKNFYKRKFFRIIIPYLIFCIFLFILKKYNFNLNNILKILDGEISPQLYFIPVLIQLYIIYPLINKTINKIGTKKSLIFSFLISVITMILLPKIYNFHTFLPYLFFFVFGIVSKKYYKNYGIKDTLEKINIVNFSLIIFIIYFAFSFLEKAEEYSNFQLIYAPILFILFFYINNNLSNKKIYKLISFFGRNSLYIFLVHFTILEFLYKYINLININTYIQYILFILSSFIFAFFIPAILSEKIKLLKNKN